MMIEFILLLKNKHIVDIKTDVYKVLFKSISENKIENTCNWITGVYVLNILRTWEKLLLC